MAMNFVYLPYEYLEEMEMLTDEEFGRLTRGMLVYAQTGEMPDLCGSERFFGVRVRNQLDRNRKHYEEKMEARSEQARRAAQARWGTADAPECSELPEDAEACGGMLEDAVDANTTPNTNPNPNSNPSTSQKRKEKTNPSLEKDTQGRPTLSSSPKVTGEGETDAKGRGALRLSTEASTDFSTDFSTGRKLSPEMSTDAAPGYAMPRPVPPEDMAARKRFWHEQLEADARRNASPG